MYVRTAAADGARLVARPAKWLTYTYFDAARARRGLSCPVALHYWVRIRPLHAATRRTELELVYFCDTD